MSNDSHESVWSHLMRVDFQQGYMDAGGVRTRYVHAGAADKPTVLFVHGIGGSWEAFCANLGPFSQHFNVYAFDNIGAGFSDKPDQPIYAMDDYVSHIKAFLDVMGVKKAHMVGVSMGGWSCINFAHTYPDMVDRLVLCAASGMQREPGFTPPAAANIRNDRAKAIEDPSWENITHIFADLIADPQKRIPDLIKVRQEVYKLPEMKASMQRILAITQTENFNKSALSDDQWREIAHRVLLIESSDDSEHFRKNTHRAHALLQNSRILSMSGVAHWPPFEKPDLFNTAVIDFLGEA
jgi:2-hydroxy-6-oxonona-2,4-dienedioate hydrolase